MMEFDTVLLLVRVAFHLGIAFLLLSYQPKGARHRICVSLLASVMAASNLGLAVALITGGVEPRAMGGQWLHLAAFGSLFWLIFLCRGNVAKMIPKRHQGAH